MSAEDIAQEGLKSAEPDHSPGKPGRVLRGSKMNPYCLLRCFWSIHSPALSVYVSDLYTLDLEVRP